ncbi:hypothetical protein AAEP80_05455 [Curtobacterium sp. L3-7]|jgi:hypothetical protein|uniref:hypothetical protein n=1 Tax=Curtobacterium sp. L3-7 TaxID=3138787 RepID=UPI003B51946C
MNDHSAITAMRVVVLGIAVFVAVVVLTCCSAAWALGSVLLVLATVAGAFVVTLGAGRH